MSLVPSLRFLLWFSSASKTLVKETRLPSPSLLPFPPFPISKMFLAVDSANLQLHATNPVTSHEGTLQYGSSAG